MADTLQWTGATSGDAGVAGNYDPAQVPITGDTVVFNTGSVDVDAGLDQSAVDPAAVVIAPGYTGNIGTSSGSLLYGTITSLLFASGGAETWIGSVAATTITAITVSGGTSGANMLQLACTCPLAEIMGGTGTVTFGDSSDLTVVRMLPGAEACSLAFGSSLATITGAGGSLDVLAGSATLSTAPYAVTVSNGGSVTVNEDSGAMNSLEVDGTGRCFYNNDGTLTSLVVSGPAGYFDGRDNAVPAAVTITTAEARLGGTIDLRNHQQNFAIGTREFRGGVIFEDYGTDI